jgi:hypothetical protein
MDEQNFTGWCLIPPKIKSDKNLTGDQKLVLGRILGLIGQQGYCYAYNAWLGDEFGYTPKSISNMLSKFQSQGYVKIEVERDEKNRVTARKIYISQERFFGGADTSPSTNGEVSIHQWGGVLPGTPDKEKEGRNIKENNNIYNSVDSLKTLSLVQLNGIARKHQCRIEYIEATIERMADAQEEHPKKYVYRNYLKALHRWIENGIKFGQITQVSPEVAMYHEAIGDWH